MDSVTIDNTDQGKLDAVITWQFDQAEHLCAFVAKLDEMFQGTTADFWDDWLSDVTNIDTCNGFGLALFGAILGVPRFTVVSGTTKTPISETLYRKILKARFLLLEGNASVKDYCEYCNAIFGGGVQVSDGLDMTLTFTNGSLVEGSEEEYIFENYYDELFVFPAGVREHMTGIKFFGFHRTEGTDDDIAPFSGGVFKW